MSYPPHESEDSRAHEENAKPIATDFHSLMNEPDPPSGIKTAQRTDFESLREAVDKVYQAPQRRTLTDYLLDIATPVCIFIMVYSVIFFLLDVRYVYTEVHDQNLRYVAFFFVLGVVALNRLVARESSEESVLYILALGAVVALYTLSSSTIYGVGSMARGFLNDSPLVALAFNMTLVAFMWWAVNRLTHECCVDENEAAGDIGIITGTRRRFEEAFRERTKRRAQLERDAPRRALEDRFMPMTALDAIDPSEYEPAARQQPRPAGPSPADRLRRKHPGMSIFYFSIPAMLVYALGLPVVRHGGPAMVRDGERYMIVYTITALLLLMLTSLGGVRAYFRRRLVPIPGVIGVFWVSLGVVMTAMVVVAALSLPLPSLPPLAQVDHHETDYWTQNSTFQLRQTPPDAARQQRQSLIMLWLGRAVLGLLGLFLLYGLLRLLMDFAARIAAKPGRTPRWVHQSAGLLEGLLRRMTNLPRMPRKKRAPRVQRSISRSAGFETSLNAPNTQGWTVNDHVAHAFEALCALAEDVGAPRLPDQTPYEFMDTFPETLRGFREEADEITRLYVVAAYSPLQMTAEVEDRLRRFWLSYNRLRGRKLTRG